MDSYQLDGFDSRGDVKVIMATNRIDSLDPALIRPGRIDRKIEFPLPDDKTRRRIFNIHTGRMTLADDVNLDEYISAKEDLSGADIKAICTEAGLMALRLVVSQFLNCDPRFTLFTRTASNKQVAAIGHVEQTLYHKASRISQLRNALPENIFSVKYEENCLMIIFP